MPISDNRRNFPHYFYSLRLSFCLKLFLVCRRHWYLFRIGNEPYPAEVHFLGGTTGRLTGWIFTRPKAMRGAQNGSLFLSKNPSILYSSWMPFPPPHSPRFNSLEFRKLMMLYYWPSISLDPKTRGNKTKWVRATCSFCISSQKNLDYKSLTRSPKEPSKKRSWWNHSRSRKDVVMLL